MRLTGKDKVSRVSIDPRALRIVDSIVFKDHSALFQKMALFFEIRKWEMGHTIVNQGELIDDFFWILEGSVDIQRTLPFVERKTLKGKEIVNKVFADLSEVPHETITNVTVSTQKTLEVGLYTRNKIS